MANMPMIHNPRRGRARTAAMAALAIAVLGGTAAASAQAIPLGPCDGPCPAPRPPAPRPVTPKPKLVTVYRTTNAYSTPYLNARSRRVLRRGTYVATCEARSASAGRAHNNHWWSRLRNGTWVNNGDLRGKVKMGIGDCPAPPNDGQPRGGRRGCDDCNVPPPRPNLRAQADAIMRMHYKEFIEFKRTKRPKPFDWFDNGCSAPTKKLRELYNGLFNKPCQMHDFGYRNYGGGLRLGRNEPTRFWIDGRLWTEMRRSCRDQYRRLLQVRKKAICLTLAAAAWMAVREGGIFTFYGR